MNTQSKSQDDESGQDSYSSEIERLAMMARPELGVLLSAYIAKNRFGVSRRTDDDCPPPDSLRAVNKLSTVVSSDKYMEICREAVCRVMPDTFTHDPHVVLSKMLKMIAADREAKKRAWKEAQARRSEARKSAKHVPNKELRRHQIESMKDAMTQGTLHGELYLVGIPTKPIPKSRKNEWWRSGKNKRNRRRKVIPLQEQLGSIIAQTEDEELRKVLGDQIDKVEWYRTPEGELPF